jgi:hypothetical protein
VRLFSHASWIILILGILFDLVFGFGAHWPLGRILRADNETLVASSEEEKLRLQLLIRPLRWMHTFFVVCIWCIASIKAYLFLLAYERLDFLSGACFVVYASVAIIHWRVTGYLFAGFGLRRALTREHEAFLLDPRNSEFRYDGPVATAHHIQGVVVAVASPHQLTATHLITRGLLLDRDVTTLVSPQPDEIKEATARLCLAVQLSQLDREPVRNGTALPHRGDIDPPEPPLPSVA